MFRESQSFGDQPVQYVVRFAHEISASGVNISWKPLLRDELITCTKGKQHGEFDESCSSIQNKTSVLL